MSFHRDGSTDSIRPIWSFSVVTTTYTAPSIAICSAIPVTVVDPVTVTKTRGIPVVRRHVSEVMGDLLRSSVRPRTHRYDRSPGHTRRYFRDRTINRCTSLIISRTRISSFSHLYPRRDSTVSGPRRDFPKGVGDGSSPYQDTYSSGTRPGTSSGTFFTGTTVTLTVPPRKLPLFFPKKDCPSLRSSF